MHCTPFRNDFSALKNKIHKKLKLNLPTIKNKEKKVSLCWANMNE